MAVIMNKLRTIAVYTVGTVLAAMLCICALAVKADAFSGQIYSEGRNNSQTGELILNFDAADVNTPVAGPVNVTLVNHGNVSKYEFFPVECSAFLQYEGIELGEDDVMNVNPDTVLYDNIIVDIGSVEYVTETRTEKVPYETIECEVKTIPKGTRQVTKEGVEGEVRRSYIVKYVNGTAVDEAMYAETVITLPTEEIVNVGVGGTITGADGVTYDYSYYISMEATAYTYVPGQTTMTTATGRTLSKGIAAVDPKVIPLHTKMYVTGTYEYGYCEAEDTGGAIKGNIVDLAFPTYDECIQFGRRNVVVYILE